MCAAPNSTNVPNSSTKTTPSTKPVPKWLKMKQQNKSSAGKTAKPTVQKSSGSAQKPQQETRNAKRARWAKKSKPVAKVAPVKRGPVKSYTSACCSLPATKPACGLKIATIDPETGKPAKKAKSTGLGHFRCSQCHKTCKVVPQAPKAKVTMGTVEGADLGRGAAIIGGSFPDIVYPAPLHTPVLEVANG